MCRFMNLMLLAALLFIIVRTGWSVSEIVLPMPKRFLLKISSVPRSTKAVGRFVSPITSLKVILKSNAYAEPAPWGRLCEAADAMNIDWKGSGERYRKVARADGDDILNRVAQAVDMGVHIEVSVPVYHDSTIDEYAAFRDLLAAISPTIPVHLLKLFPANRTGHLSLTSDFLLKKVHRFISEKMPYTYIANVFGDDFKPFRDTVCSGCGVLLIERTALQSKVHCMKCCDHFPIRS
jgi:hypothetical protein